MESTSDMSFATFVGLAITVAVTLFIVCGLSMIFTEIETRQQQRRQRRIDSRRELEWSRLNSQPAFTRMKLNKAERIAREYPEMDRRSTA